MTKTTHLALLYAVIIVGLLISPVMAVTNAPGEAFYRPFNGAQERPDIDGDMIVWEDDRYDEQRTGVRDIFLATVEEFRSTPKYSPVGTRITDDPASQEKPSISGDYIAWQDNRHGNWDIYLYRRSTGEETRLTTDSGKQWLPIVRGNYIAWYDSSSGRTNVVLYDIAAGTVKDVIDANAKTTIPGGTTEFKPALSEQYVAWVEPGDETAYTYDKVYYYDIAAGRIVGPIAPTPGNEGLPSISQSWPSLSGSFIVWEDTLDRMDPDIYVADISDLAGGGGMVTRNDFDQVSPAIDGGIIVWEDKQIPERSIFIYDLFAVGDFQGKEMCVVEAEDPNDAHLYPAVSGNTIVWQRGRGPDSNLYIFVYESEPAERVVTHVDITPATATLDLGETEPFAALVRDQFGRKLSGVTVNWTNDNETVGTIDDTGLFAALAAGTTTVTAKAGNVSGTATVTVNAGEPADPVATEVAITPLTPTVTVNNTVAFAATVRDQFDRAMTGVNVTWASSNTTVGTIDESSGLFATLAAGTTTVTASAGEVSGTATVTVNAEEPVGPEEPVLTRIAVSPSAATLEVGDELEFCVVAFDRFGDIVEDARVTWECSDSCIGTIDECGVFTALAAGMATVTACRDGAEGTATVTVNCDEPALSSIVITPSAITLAKGDTAAFTATALDQDGCEMPGVIIDWECSSEAIGTIDLCSGFFAALDCGTATVTATADGVTATADVEITDERSGIVVSPSAIILDPGDEWQFTTTVYDLQDNTSEPTITWSCDDEGVGTITSDGLFTAVCEGSTPVMATVAGENETLIGTATVTVRSASPELARIVVSPSDFTIAAGNSLTLTAFDRHGCPIEDGVTWESSDPCVGTVDECGTFTAIEAGAVTLTASANGITDSACVTVLPSLPVPTCIEVEPVTVTMQTGETQAFTATVFDQCDNIMDCVEVTWSCSDPEVGTIDATGLFVASGMGTTAVTASAGCAAATATVTVTAAPTPEPTVEPTTPVSAGSGDSGGDSSPTFDAKMHENLAAGQTFTFSSTTSSVGSVSITAANTIPKLMLTVKKATPSATEPPAGDIYEYVEITLNWANPDDIDNATIEFTIPAAWLEDHGMTPEDVRFMRCVNGAWQTLDTVVLGEENGLYRFRATTPGFSTFAIAAAPANVTASAEGVDVTPEITETPDVTQTPEPTETVPATTPTTAPLVYAPFLAPLAFLLWARKNR